ncbi:MAG: NAD(P)-binding domain-containing protein [Chitinophagaceae bacterium]|nr:NAD(P)-binding domain-containing protein [Chitinophagaceae bacterium]
MAKKTIAIIGATETIGAIIAKNLSRGNYRLLLFGHDQAQLQGVAEGIKEVNPAADIDCISCLVDASWEADIIISAVPAGAEEQVAKKIREVATQKIVISIPNPVTISSGSSVSRGTSAAEELQKLLPNSKVVKTFNTADAVDLARAIADGKQIDSFIAGNDEEAVLTVREIVSNAGFHPIMAGELATSRALENARLVK